MKGMGYEVEEVEEGRERKQRGRKKPQITSN